ncbi:hypothetical protein ESCO_006835 [Escovopsis weberi]|uniref:Nephrocystin 3-like N-terminal domain-containing protein n=1 Tax=Escovopsis weberi TaxID=150374 RepID=A0A0M8N0K4_ESCWE|nr:hypothetical protein ESCO_006835 [Escovopsis weberi]
MTSIKSARAAEHSGNGGNSHQRSASATASSPRLKTGLRRSSLSPRLQMDELHSISEVLSIDLAAYLEYIKQERLTRLPRRGSDWDRVLQAAQFFGLQVWSFDDKINSLKHGKRSLSSILGDIGRIPDLDDLAPGIQNDAVRIFADIVLLIKGMAVEYQQRVGGLKTGSQSFISIDALFGTKIRSIYQARETLAERIWVEKLDTASFSLTLKELSWKLQSPVRQTVYNRLFGHVDDHFDRSEESCHWFRDQLSQFFSEQDRMFCITGAPSSGKTVLAEWVEERLSRPVDGQSHAVLRFDFPYNSPQEATPVAFLKDILFKLLEQNIGNVPLYEAMMRAFEGHHREREVDESLEPALWIALRECLRHAHHYSASLVIISDHCDWVAGGRRDSFIAALHDCVSQIPSVRAITFCREPPKLSASYRHFCITDQEVREDISTHFAEILLQSPHFQELSREEFQRLVVGLVEKSKGNWLWVFYAGRLLFNKRSKSSIVSASQELPADISEVLQQVIELLQIGTNPVLKALLSLMLVVGRPLAVTEFIQLFANDPHHTGGEGSVAAPNMTALISEVCDDIVIVKGGYVHFRTEVVQSFLRAQLGSLSLPSVQEANRELTLRMLLYARLLLSDEGELSVNELPHEYVTSLFYRNPLLGYVVQTWAYHVEASGTLLSEDQAHIRKELSHVFPSSVTFALLETTCWTKMRSFDDLVSSLKLALRIREACFEEVHVAVLQTLINLGRVPVDERVESEVVAAASFYRRATKVGAMLLGESSLVVEKCMILFLDITESITLTTRNEMAAWREEMIQSIIKVLKNKNGASSDEVIHWYNKLALLYININEEHHATVVYQDLYKATVHRYGEKSTEAKEIGNNFGNLNLVLRGKSVDEIHEYEYFILKTSEHEVTPADHSIKNLKQLADSYVAHGSHTRAERLYARLWQRASVSASAPGAEVQHHVAKIRIALEYSKFLVEQKRHEEAYNILICLWAEYQKSTFEDVEEVQLCLREVGQAMRGFGATHLAVTILNQVWAFFKRNGKGSDEEAKKTTGLITEVVDEITEVRSRSLVVGSAATAAGTTTSSGAVTTVTTITEDTEISETVMYEIFDFHIERGQKAGVDRDFFSVCSALINIHVQRQDWQKAEAAITKTLEVAWKAILTHNVKIKLCGHANVAESIQVARQLAACYSEQGHFEMAERVHLQMFYACLENLPLEDGLLIETIDVLVKFYEKHHRHAEIIGIYVEVLQRYQTDLGRKHRLTIRTLYSLADRCMMLGRQDAYHHYLEIVNVLNHNINYCHPDAVPAALVLCKYYHARGRWTELQQICVLLWETIINHRSEYTATEETITFVFGKYMHVLELDSNVDFSALYKLSVEYKDVVSVVCGFKSPLVTKTIIALAKVCERDEAHHQEALSLYEEVLTVVSEEDTVTRSAMKKSLSKMYVKVSMTRTRSGSEAAATANIDRAVKVAAESYELTKAEYKCWHENTLVKLRDVVTLHLRMNTEESRSQAYELLQSSVKEIITTTNTKTASNVNMSLFESAKTLADIFAKAEMIKEGQQLLTQLRQFIVFQGTPVTSAPTTLELSARLTKVAFIFLIGFEHGLNGGDAYSKDLAEVQLESVLYAEYSRTIEKETKLETVLQYGARLRNFWEFHKRVELLEFLDKRLFPLFKSEYAQCFEHVDDRDVMLLYCCLLAELGDAQPNSKFDLATFICQAANTEVHRLLSKGKFETANRLANCVFCFSEKQRLYHYSSRIQYGYKLAEYMAGIGVTLPHGFEENPMWAAMLETSTRIMTDILAAFVTIKLDYKSLRFEDLDHLIRLLGTQRNFRELETLLSQLWRHRDHVRTAFGCEPAAVLEIGIYLVHAQYAMGDVLRAVDTASNMYYNLQRGNGRLDISTLEVGRLLASLYMSTHRPKKALILHEAILKEISNVLSTGGENGEAEHIHPQYLAEQQAIHLQLLRVAHQQCHDYARPDIEKMCARLTEIVAVKLPEFDATIVLAKVDTSGEYAAPGKWTIEKLGVGRTEKEIDSEARWQLVENARKEHVFDWPLSPR